MSAGRALKTMSKRSKCPFGSMATGRDMPIVVRPHPDASSEYAYEHVTGQCRFKACLELGLEDIPAFVFDLSDEQAIQRSMA